MTAPRQMQEMWAVQFSSGRIDSIHEKREWALYCVQAVKMTDPSASARVVRVRVEVVDDE